MEISELMTQNELRQLIGLVKLDIESESTDTHITNCKNCGAPLTRGGYCEYCGTQY